MLGVWLYRSVDVVVYDVSLVSYIMCNNFIQYIKEDRENTGEKGNTYLSEVE